MTSGVVICNCRGKEIKTIYIIHVIINEINNAIIFLCQCKDGKFILTSLHAKDPFVVMTMYIAIPQWNAATQLLWALIPSPGNQA